jgi:hypothetical protein
MEGLRESVNAFKSEVKGVEAKTVMDLMIVTQYFDMMKDVGAQGKTAAIFLRNDGGGDVSFVEFYRWWDRKSDGSALGLAKDRVDLQVSAFSVSGYSYKTGQVESADTKLQLSTTSHQRVAELAGSA